MTLLLLVPAIVPSVAAAATSVGIPSRPLAPPIQDRPQSPPTPDPNLNFNLLAPPTTTASRVSLTPPVDEALVKRRRLMLTLHQIVGVALTAGMVGSMITGQLNYDDKFLGQNSGRYQLIHSAFVFPTEALALVTAGLAIFAPVPIAKHGGFDRMTLHKIGQFTAFAGWATELVLGLMTASHEGYANQRGLATAHLAVGYVTLGGVLLGLGAITF